MQLSRPLELKPRALRQQLMVASCALLGVTASAQDAPTSQANGTLLDGITLDSALAYYHEDGRIQAIEPIVNVNKTFSDGEVLSLTGTFDALTGASPNGALTSRSPQTFASPSGTSLSGTRRNYTINPGQYPVDSRYQDTRLAIGANWDVPYTRLTTLSFGGKVSYEDDFLSITANAGIAHDFNEKNTTLSFGLSEEYDRLSPIGGTPVPDSGYALFDKTGGESKDGTAALLGVTQVLRRNWIVEFNLSADRFRGYLNDPYKITSVLNSTGETLGYVYENRPAQRTRESVYLENRAAWDSFSAALSVRYMRDNWQIHSDTVQLSPRWTFSDRSRYIEPTIRWYRQSAASFYAPWIPNTNSVPEYQASDERLSAFHALTYGLKFEQNLPGQENHLGRNFSIRLEYYQQTFTQPQVPTSLQGLDFLPPLKSILFQIGFEY